MKNLFSAYNFIKHNKKIFIKKKSKKKILIDYFEYKPSFLPFSYIANVLAEKYDAEIFGADNFYRTFRQKIRIILQKIWFLSNWNIYRSFGVKKLVSPKLSDSLITKSNKIYKEITKKIKHKKDILKILINRIPVGDLIYDDYLREKNYSTVDIDKDDFKKHLLKMIQLFVFWYDYIKKNDVKACLISHSVYKFGLLTRIAIYNNIKVINGSSAATYSLNKKNMLTSVGYENYPKTFKIINQKTKKNLYKIAKTELEQKLTGKIDVTQIINKNQEFKSFKLSKSRKFKKNISNNKQTTVLVAAHCFTDAVHAFDKTLFLDFYDWLDFLGQISNKTNYKWLVKLHPSHWALNKDHMQYFIDKYPKFELVKKFETHNDILEKNKISAVLTVYGSIGHEYPLFGVPVINAHPSGSNPHSAYNFNLNPKSINELEKIILNIERIKFKITAKLKKEIYEYYYTRVFADYYFFHNNKKVFMKLKNKYSTSAVFNEWLKIYDVKMHELHKQNYLSFINSGTYRMIADNTGKLSKVIL